MIEELTLRGFKSYRSRQTVRFTRGVNKISGRNASGKTTLLQAVLFGLFGDVPGVNKQDLIPLNGADVDVTLALRSPLNGKRITIHREGGQTRDGGFRSSKSLLKVEGEDATYAREREIQTKLRELIGVGRSTFFNVVYAQQKEFIEILKPDRRRMDAILGLTTPAEIREQFREVSRMLRDRGRIEKRGALEERVRNAEQGISDLDGQLVEVTERRRDLSEGLNQMKVRLTLANGRVETMDGILAELRRVEMSQADLERLQEQREDVARDLEDIYVEMGEDPEKTRRELQERRSSAETTEEELRRLLDGRLARDRAETVGAVSRLEHQIGEHVELREQGVTVCPKCGQEVNFDLLEKDVKQWQAELEQERGRLKALEREISMVQEQAKAASRRFRDADRAVINFVNQERRINELKKTMQDLEARGADLHARIGRETEELLLKAEMELATAFASLEDAQEKIGEQLDGSRREQRELQAEVRSREDRLKDADREEERIQGQQEGHRKVLEESLGLLDGIREYEAKIRAVDSIQRRYGEYEQQLRENTLKLLEYQTYNYFRRLTDQQSYAGCHIDRERYTLEVQPLGGNRMMPAWLAGGGHESLFALAERLALLRVMGFPHLLILDEPTDAVDSENVPQLLEYVARSSREIGQVLLVTHHGHGEEEGVNLIRVRKVGEESRVYQE
ncbi:MAG: AAA family ATPase [Candidatus Bathyarchaeota archaeon]|nr:MAG: AAA family ATPase [Candidatus Bathyarchaeota archaeon]